MTVLLDTTVIIDSLRRFEPAERYLLRLAADQPLRASILTRFEIRAGSGGASAEVESLVRQVAWEPVSEAVADRAGAFAQSYRKAFPGVTEVDLLIAATADVLELDIATRNVRHFPMFPGLVAPY